MPLTGGEYDLLLALVERANRVLTRDMLLDLLRGRQAGPFDRAIDVAISRLRRKLEDDGRNAQLIKTVRGGGYVLARHGRTLSVDPTGRSPGPSRLGPGLSGPPGSGRGASRRAPRWCCWSVWRWCRRPG